jgi:hypothetical protein
MLTNPRIIGCGERNSAYRSARDLDRLEIEARLRRRALFRSFRYAVDQINHDKFTPAEELLRWPRVRLIILVREPLASISSLIRLTRTHYEEWPVAKAVDYYTERVAMLTRLARAAAPSGQVLLLTYGELIENTAAMFDRLQSFLGLETGFSEQYALQDFTGTRGDPAEKISTGRIVRNDPTPMLEIPAMQADRAYAAYRAYEQSITSLVRTNRSAGH